MEEAFETSNRKTELAQELSSPKTRSANVKQESSLGGVNITPADSQKGKMLTGGFDPSYNFSISATSHLEEWICFSWFLLQPQAPLSWNAHGGDEKTA